MWPLMACPQGLIPPDPLNGLSCKTGLPEVYTLEDRSTQGITITLVLRTGPLYEQPADNGFALVLKYAFWQMASAHQDPSVLQLRLDSMNARISSFAGSGFTAFEIRTDSAHLGDALELLSACSHDMAVENIDMEAIRERCIQELKTRDQDLEHLILEACLDRCFGSEGYRIHGRPSPMVVFGSSTSRFADYLSQHLVRSAMSIWVSGRIEPSVVREKAGGLPWGISDGPSPLLPVMHFSEPDSVAYPFYLDNVKGISLRLCLPILYPDSLAQVPVAAAWCASMMNHAGWHGFSALEERYPVSFDRADFHASRGCGVLVIRFNVEDADSLPAFTRELLWITARPAAWLISGETAENARNNLLWDYLDGSDATWSFTRDLWKMWANGGYHLTRMYAHYLQFIGSASILEFFQSARTSVRPFVVVAADPHVKLPDIPLMGTAPVSPIISPKPGGNTPVVANPPLSDIRFSTGYLLADPGLVKQRLATIASYMKQYPGITLEITGHSDKLGSPTARQMVAMGRASLIRDMLVQQGIDPAKLSLVNASDSQPVYTGTSVQQQKQNRRVTLKWK